MILLSKVFPTLDCASCIATPQRMPHPIKLFNDVLDMGGEIIFQSTGIYASRLCET
jgi:hypothetical protein